MTSNEYYNKNNIDYQLKIKKIIESIEKVNQETKNMIYQMSCNMSELEIIQSFNQKTQDLFNILCTLSNKLNMEKELKMNGYRNLFNNAIKINVGMPIDQFTLTILEYANEIYTEKEDCFLNMPIADQTVSVGNEFSIIRSEEFKKIWRNLTEDYKTMIKENFIPLTTFAHAYLYKTIMKK